MPVALGASAAAGGAGGGGGGDASPTAGDGAPGRVSSESDVDGGVMGTMEGLKLAGKK